MTEHFASSDICQFMLELTDVNLPGSDRSPADTFAHTFVPGEISVVLGANQSGKTDMCRLIAGLPTRASGKVSIDGKSAGSGPRERPVAMVYQAFINYPNLSVADNIASPLKAQRRPRGEIDARVDELADKLGLEALLHRRPAELSGGQQQRLAIARALAKEARVLLLDEPLVNLDFKLREALQLELRALLKATDTVVVYTSSDPRDAFALGDQVLLLAAGRKLQSGVPIDVYTAPANLAAMQLLSDPGVNLFTEADSTCAVRPEHLGVDGRGDLKFDMTVTAIETNGDESFAHGEVLGQEWVVRARGMLDVEPGATLALSARANDIRRFG